MKIQHIETFLVNLGGPNRVMVRVMTDEHIHGTGEVSCVGPDEATVQTTRYFRDWLIGQDPIRIESRGNCWPDHSANLPVGFLRLRAVVRSQASRLAVDVNRSAIDPTLLVHMAAIPGWAVRSSRHGDPQGSKSWVVTGFTGL
jgi:L-alanine-DL-glutamate epimerase-like enolase superfamily enzyme